MTVRQKEKIERNLTAYKHNFPSIRIESADYGGGFYVYSPAEADSWVQYCPNIDYLDGWLYGMVQGINRCVKPLTEAEKQKRISEV